MTDEAIRFRGRYTLDELIAKQKRERFGWAYRSTLMAVFMVLGLGAAAVASLM